MLYAAVVLMVICLTVLSLQQLLDASQYKYRFSVLHKLGVDDTHIGKLVLKQLGIWFGLPIVVAIIVSTMVIIYFIQTISAEICLYWFRRIDVTNRYDGKHSCFAIDLLLHQHMVIV